MHQKLLKSAHYIELGSYQYWPVLVPRGIRLYTYEQIPVSLKDNPYITDGYRAYLPSRLCIKRYSGCSLRRILSSHAFCLLSPSFSAILCAHQFLTFGPFIFFLLSLLRGPLIHEITMIFTVVIGPFSIGPLLFTTRFYILFSIW